MAFYKFGLNIGRGQVHDSATELNIATHTYKYESDTLATIASADYFPDYLGASSEEVKINDILIARGSDTVDTFTITAVAPLTIEPQAEATGNVTGPVSSTLNAVARYTDTTGKVLGNSGITISNTNNIDTAVAGALTIGGTNATSVEIGAANDVEIYMTGGVSISNFLGVDGLGILTDTIDNITPSAGVTIEGVTLEDNGVTFPAVAANPGATRTLWVRNSDGHLMFGAVDLQA